MKKKALVVAFAVLAAVGIAWAAPFEIFRTPVVMTGGLQVGSASTVGTAANKVSKSLGGRLNYVFPALANDGGTIACANSWGVTVTGATFGDVCHVGVGYGATAILDTALDPVESNQFTCFVSAANTVMVRRCGGQSAAALADAGYNIRVISNE